MGSEWECDMWENNCFLREKVEGALDDREQKKISVCDMR